MKAVPLDPRMVKEDSMDWRLFDETPDFRRWCAMNEHGDFVVKTEYIMDEALIAQNKQSYDDSHGKRFGDGKVVASIPLNKFYRELAPRMEDKDFMKWWLNQDENRPYRTFRGRV